VSGARRSQPLFKLRHCSMLWRRGWKNHRRKQNEENYASHSLRQY